MKKILLVAFALLTFARPAIADEGMWLLPFIEKLNIKDMKAKGFKLSAEDIYSLNKSALKDAIVIFGGGCTGEIISPKGLILTNHHCGYGAIQQHSSVENDYLKYGFWAMSPDKEIPTPGLGVVFIREIKDVTSQIMPQLNDKMTDKERAAKVAEISKEIQAAAAKPDQNLTARVVPMFGGNQYLLFVQERFGDVRMVGAPPSSIGKFGGETDNWMWPRHTGDFSMFRVYANKDNKSTTEYSKDNQPYAPKQHLKVSLKGYKEGDFAMIMGFPGSTQRYMTSWEIDQTLEQDNPIRIYIRGERQDLMKEDMLASDKVRIQYSSKYAGSSNYWKNAIGKSRGLKKLNVRAQKVAEQEAFTAWVNADPARKEKYGEALVLIEQAVEGRRPAAKEAQYIQEALNNVEAFQLARTVDMVMNQVPADKQKEALQKAGDEFFKNYNQATDIKIAPRMMEIYAEAIPAASEPSFFKEARRSIAAYNGKLFTNSIFVDQDKYNKWVQTASPEAIANDPAMVAARSLGEKTKELYGNIGSYSEMFARGHRLYLAGLLEMNAGKKSMYPDANFTMRMTYGQALPYWAADAVFYNMNTNLKGVIEKEDPTNPEFVVPEKLKELYKNKDFGPYAVNGDVPVAMLTSNDITGGNSGSPVMNGNGELIGLAFDGNWEAMSGDIAFEPNLQRTISVDIRYVLFIIDKFAGAKNLIQEMTIVK